MLMVILLVLHQVTEHTFFFSFSVILGSSCIFCSKVCASHTPLLHGTMLFNNLQQDCYSTGSEL